MSDGAPGSVDVELAEIGLCVHDGNEGTVGEQCPAPECSALGRRFIPTALSPALGAAPPEALLGTLVGEEWLLVHAIGRGGMGRVYLALQRPHYVIKGALKLLDLRDAQPAAADTLRRRFFAEHAALARLEHPNIVRILRYGYHGAGRQPYLVMEYVSGGTTLGHRLRALRSGGRRLARGDVRRCLEQMLGGLQAAHEQGVVHGDIKPSNIMAQDPVAPFRPWYLRLVDFGASKFLETPGAATGFVLVTPRYMAPEQLYARDLVGPGTDLYAVSLLACLLLRMEHPFSKPDAHEVCRIRSGPGLHARSLDWLSDQGFARPLERLLRRGLAYHPADRFPTAAAYAEELALVWESGDAASFEPLSGLSTSPGVRAAQLAGPPRLDPGPGVAPELELSRAQLQALWGAPTDGLGVPAVGPETNLGSSDGGYAWPDPETRPEQVPRDRGREPTEPESAALYDPLHSELSGELTQKELLSLLSDLGNSGSHEGGEVGAAWPADPGAWGAGSCGEPSPILGADTVHMLAAPEAVAELADAPIAEPIADPIAADTIHMPATGPPAAAPLEPDPLEVDTVHLPMDAALADAVPVPAVMSSDPLGPGPRSRGLGHLPTMQIGPDAVAAHFAAMEAAGGAVAPEVPVAGGGLPALGLGLGGGLSALPGSVWSPQLDDPRVTQPLDTSEASGPVDLGARRNSPPATPPTGRPVEPTWNWGAPPGSPAPALAPTLPKPPPLLRPDPGPAPSPWPASGRDASGRSRRGRGSRGWIRRLLDWLRPAR